MEKNSYLKRELLALQNLQFLHFLCVIFALQDPDPADKMNADPDHNTRLFCSSSANFSALTLASIELLSPDGL